MTKRKLGLLFAALLPICLLGAEAVYYQSIIKNGLELTLPIEGYDPRAILSGHYLAFKINYNQRVRCQRDCRVNDKQQLICKDLPDKQYLCISTNKVIAEHTQLDKQAPDCTYALTGVCRNGEFIADISRFYIPEGDAERLNAMIVAKGAKIILRLDRNANTIVQDLLINNVSWKKYLETAP